MQSMLKRSTEYAKQETLQGGFECKVHLKSLHVSQIHSATNLWGKSVHLEQYVSVILRNVDGAAEVAASLHSFILSLWVDSSIVWLVVPVVGNQGNWMFPMVFSNYEKEIGRIHKWNSTTRCIKEANNDDCHKTMGVTNDKWHPHCSDIEIIWLLINPV